MGRGFIISIRTESSAETNAIRRIPTSRIRHSFSHTRFPIACCSLENRPCVTRRDDDTMGRDEKSSAIHAQTMCSSGIARQHPGPLPPVRFKQKRSIDCGGNNGNCPWHYSLAKVAQVDILNYKSPSLCPHQLLIDKHAHKPYANRQLRIIIAVLAVHAC